MMSLRTSLVILTALSGLAGCSDKSLDGNNSDKADENTPVDENGVTVHLSPLDTSFLIPMIDGAPQVPLTPSMLPFERFQEVHDQTEFNGAESSDLSSGSTADDIYDSLFVVGVRYDPCSTQAFHGSSSEPDRIPEEECEEELRLVVQPSNSRGFADMAMHVVYALSDTDAVGFRNALREMRMACNGHPNEDGGKTDGVPVGFHPCMEGDAAFIKQNLSEKILTKFAKHQRLKGIATMVTVAADPVEWHWQLLVRSPAGGLIALPALPNEPASDRRGVMVFRPDGSYLFKDQVAENGSRLEPATQLSELDGSTVPSVAISAISTTRNSAQLDLSDPDVQDGLVAAYLSENPRLTKLPDAAKFVPTVFQGNMAQRVQGPECVSCHVQSPVLTVLEDTGLIERLDEVPALRDRVQAAAFKDLSVITDGHWAPARTSQKQVLINGNYLVLNFGFLFDSPSVNRRVQHEAEDAARYIDEVLRKADTPPEPLEPEPVSTEYATASCDVAPAESFSSCLLLFEAEDGALVLYETTGVPSEQTGCMAVEIISDDGTETETSLNLERRSVEIEGSSVAGWWDANGVIGFTIEGEELKVIDKKTGAKEAMSCFPVGG